MSEESIEYQMFLFAQNHIAEIVQASKIPIREKSEILTMLDVLRFLFHIILKEKKRGSEFPTKFQTNRR